MISVTGTSTTDGADSLKLDGEAKPALRYGWVCPKCGAVNSPDAQRCGCVPVQGAPLPQQPWYPWMTTPQWWQTEPQWQMYPPGTIFY